MTRWNLDRSDSRFTRFFQKPKMGPTQRLETTRDAANEVGADSTAENSVRAKPQGLKTAGGSGTEDAHTDHGDDGHSINHKHGDDHDACELPKSALFVKSRSEGIR